MQFLKAGTAKEISFGPFVDKTDGVTLKTDATTITDIDHATTGIFLSKNGTNAAVRHQNVTASVANDYGMMTVTLDATDTATVGTLDVLFAKAATYLPVHKSFMVIPADLYDTWMVAQPAAAIKKFFDKASPTGTVNSLPDAVAGAASGIAIVGSSVAVGSIANDAITAASINAGAFTADAFAADVDAEIAAMVWNAATASYGGAGSYGQAAEDTLADTAELQTNQGNWLTATGFATPTNITAGTITHATNVTNPVSILRPTGAVATDAGNSATAFKTNLTSATADFWVGAWVKITSGDLLGQVRKISDYDGANKIITVSPAFTGTPADAVTFVIVNE